MNAAIRPTLADANPVTLGGKEYEKSISLTFKNRLSFCWDIYHPVAAPIRTCLVADCLLTSAKILSKKLSSFVDGIFPIDKFFSCFSFFVVTIPVFDKSNKMNEIYFEFVDE